eukprot:gene2937-3223_t
MSVSVRCVLAVHERKMTPVPGLGQGSGWFGGSQAAVGAPSSWGRLGPALRKYGQALMDTHNTWKSQLHRVGSMIRSTSRDALASLGSGNGSKVAGPRQPAAPGPEPPSPDNEDEESEQLNALKSGLSCFLTTAGRSELSEAAMLSDLSNMAYDVAAINLQQLQAAHGLTIIASSRPLQLGLMLPAPSITVADSAAGQAPVRYIVIQGSITLDHWRINLTIDPCEFEGGALGRVKVHRGVYQAALSMYSQFVPLVEEHLARDPEAKVAFTGHSLGGSLATLLMLLLVHRPCSSCALPCQHRKAPEAAGASKTAGLLQRLGLSDDSVVNVIMTRDIVPRVFVCDYTLVADVLKRWVPSFKEHGGLAACKEHKALYNFIGTMEVLQPSMSCSFVLPDEGHMMLPDGAALYKLEEPSCHLPAQHQPELPSAGQMGAVRSSDGDASSSDSSSYQGEHQKPGQRKGLGSLSFGSLTGLAQLGSMSLSGALADLTNSFPLFGGSSGGGSGSDGDTLGEMRAYGPAGSISRFHNPNSYTLALQDLCDRE